MYVNTVRCYGNMAGGKYNSAASVGLGKTFQNFRKKNCVGKRPEKKLIQSTQCLKK